jgi:hypothetical protein
VQRLLQETQACCQDAIEVFLTISEKINNRIVAGLVAAALAAALSCVPRAPRQAPAPWKTPAEADMISVFFTGSTLGKLKPCGCSGGQLGGLERRPAVFAGVPAEKRLLIDTGSLVEMDRDQDLIKFSIIIEALGLLDYNVVNLSEKDLEIAENLGLVGSPIVQFISAYGPRREIGARFDRRYLLDGEYVTISVLAFDADKSPIEQIQEGFGPRTPGQKGVNILLTNRCEESVIASVARLGVVDCVVCPFEADEPGIIGSPNREPLVFSVGRYGRYICRLQIEKAGVGDRLKLKFYSIPVEEDIAEDATLVELYKGYQQIVRDRNLLAEHPRYPLSNGLTYAGSQSCKACHEPQYAKWRRTPHAHAYATLEEVGSQFDPECVVCHVVGMDYQSGFVSAEETPQLKDVGCEICHGPGSEHVKTLAATTDPKSTCIDCHTPEHSGEYAGNEQSFRQKIIHWTEPNAPSNVK